MRARRGFPEFASSKDLQLRCLLASRTVYLTRITRILPTISKVTSQCSHNFSREWIQQRHCDRDRRIMNLIFLFLASCAFIPLFFANAEDLSTYLDEKLRQSKIELIKIHIQKTSPVKENLYQAYWNILWRVFVTKEHQPFIINTFDRIHILDGNRVMIPSINETSSNKTLTLREIGRIKQFRIVKFVRSIVWENTTYMLVCYELYLCSLHTITRNNTLRFRHTIRHRGTSVDAKFFTQRRQLYVIIANNADIFPVPSVIYRWTGTYMDVVVEVMAIGAKSVTAFEYRQSTIIVFAQYDAENPRSGGSEVYEFRGKDITKIQFLFITRPTSVHHFIHGDFNFIFVLSEFEPSSLLCWTGRELFDWISFPEVNSHSLINIFHMDGDTFILVAYRNIIQLYKFHSTSDLKSESMKHLKNGQNIIDMAVSLNAHTITVMLVIKEMDEYWVEQWEAEIISIPVHTVEKNADSTKCLSELIIMLQSRMIEVKEANVSSKFLLPSAENVTRTEPINFNNVILQTGTVNSVEIVVEEGEDILPPHHIEQALNELDFEVDNIVSKWQEMIDTHTYHVLNNNGVINNAFLEEFKIDRMNVDFVNDVKQDQTILPEDEQEFVNPLQGENIFAQALEVDSLCGIPSRYWTLRNDTTNLITATNDSVEYSNDTITVHSDLIIEKLRTNSLNGTVINQLIDDLFIINDHQEIKGQITYSNLAIKNLTTQMLNGVPADKLMTIATNQNFDNFFVKYLEISNLHAKTVNEVPVEEAARKSRENFIRGKVNMARLHITENFTVDVNASLIIIPKQRPLQIYQNVTILGDLHLQNIMVSPFATLFVADTPVNVSDMFNSFWTKSSNQTIVGDVTFKDGLSIDNLNTKYLNGFVENDFLYTTMEEIPSEFTNLHFENFHVKDSFLHDGRNISFFNAVNKTLIINERLHLRNLQAEDVFTLAFNGMSVNSIMSGSVANFTGVKELPAIQARRVLVDNFNLRLLNDRKVWFEEGLRVDDDHELDVLKVPEFYVRSLEVERLNDAEINLLTRLKDLTSSNLSRIVVVGDLTVKNLTVDQVGGQSTDSFLEKLAQNDIVLSTEKIDNLVARNVTLTSLYGQNFDDFVDSVLTKSTAQIVPGHFSAHNVTSDNVTTSFFNGQNVSQLMWVDEPLTFVGNVTFIDLIVEGDVITSSLNGQQVNKLYDSLLLISAKDIDLLKVNGNVFWDVPSYSPASISYLLEKAVTKDGYQNIMGNVSFKKSVNAWAVIGPFYVTEQIQDIISDTVIDYGETIEINGSKVFEDDFVADNLKVNGDLGIRYVNHVNINEFNNSIVKKYREDTISGPLIFSKEIKIEKLRVNNPDLNASIKAAVRFVDILPDNVFFEDLELYGNVYLIYLDGINFDEFVKNRVTLSGNHNVWCDMKFKEPVTITGKATLNKINGINSYNFVLNEDAEKQIITGTKIFEQDLIVQGSVTAARINDKNITAEYNQGVFNDEEVDIYGNLIFKADVRIEEMDNFGLANGIAVRSIIGNFEEKTNETLYRLKENERNIVRNIAYSSQVYETLRNVFFYLEVEENPMISASNVTHVDVLYLEKTTRLNMNVKQPGSHCGLPDDCACVKQLVVELSDETRQIQKKKLGEITKNFYDPDGVIINVMTDTVSSSKQCTSTRAEEEFITVSLNNFEHNNLWQIMFSIDVPDVEGKYWKDAKIFKHDGDIYIILAVYYNKIQETHHTNSLLCKVDVAKEKVRLIQKIPTNGAWSVEILEIDQTEVFVLIGCFGDSSESLLYRFDAVTQQIQQIRTFVSRSRYVKSLSQGKDHFVLLDNPDTNAVDIYKYDPVFRNFYSYQSIFHDRQVSGIEIFYVDDYDDSDVFVIVTTENERFYIYEYMFAGKFQMRMQHIVDGLRTMMPFYHMNRQYIFAGTDGDSRIFRIVQQGPH